ncbi:MAG: hypothetical protein ACREQA_13570, partial [Candidatus Binatia bacterium]
MNVIELNVGSLLDWPIHFRDFQLLAGSAPNIVHSDAYLFSPNSNNGGNGVSNLTCDSAWYPDKDVNIARGQERMSLRNELMPNRVKGFFRSLGPVRTKKASKKRWQFFLKNLRAELWEYQALLDTFPLAQPIQYRREIETELKNPGVDSVLSLLRTLRADET